MVSQATRTLPFMMTKLSSMDELASSQRSLVTRKQLLEAGFKPTRIAGFLRSRALRPVRPRVYAMTGSIRDWRQTLMASILTFDQPAVGSHGAAARLWDYVHRPESCVDVLYEGDLYRRREGVHRTTILPDEDVTVRFGIPCTSFERTLCDCTTLLSPFQLGRVLDDGLRRGNASLVRLHACAARLDSGPNRRLGVIKTLLAQRDASYDPGGSASELELLRIVREAGLPEPVQQFEVRADGHPYVFDFAWPAQKVYAEYYGLAVHSGASAVEHDSERITALTTEGWRPLIFTDSTPDGQVVRKIREALSKSPSDGDDEHRLSA
jgi:very-short-patch-repair endonuclease